MTWSEDASLELSEILPDLDDAPLALVIDLVRRGRARTRPELVQLSGLGRKVVAQRVDQAVQLGLLREAGLAPSDGGRQARVHEFVPDAGLLWVAHVGVTALRCAIVDLEGNVVSELFEEWSVGAGPERTMERVVGHLHRLASGLGRAASDPWAIVVGLPGPVDAVSGVVVSPPVMPGWDGFNPRAWLGRLYEAPVLVDNDANLMALGEWTVRGRDAADVLFVKIGTSISAGFLVGGELLRGARGAAGDIGHTHVTDAPTARCRCGRSGCLDAVASGWALLEKARALSGTSSALRARLAVQADLTLADIGAAARASDPVVLSLLDEAADAIATVVANLVSFTNPAAVIIGGGVLQTGDRVTTRIRERVFALCTDLVTTDLEVSSSKSEPRSGVIGGGVLAASRLLSVASLSRWAAHGSPVVSDAGGLLRRRTTSDTRDESLGSDVDPAVSVPG